ncbi:ketopantoate reductase family protein [Furfurilactobacillus siliginis]|uniref:Ketopantoate reductase N-terminal domain-containing protein n=1 Tax=Furfurilactobacillus siliginis TaxID=348151 RepID=A0A0R2L5Z0_9LACO|nr:2-dehydropantoate 2-reductase N-terminal domain-containing protein [Furfurilactobacillus siliginis]KRN97183.1 hypothetical protein IV55_GL000104 [Furfurilactobacillus siliginis]GEK28644.1 hypothetical protein LSI01_09550 [Furfurilactobacillus siliginis]
MKKQKRILIFGAGVIGSAYAVKFIEAGVDVTLFARSTRYVTLKRDGLRYLKKGKLVTVRAKVIDKLADDDIYDFIFVTVRADKAASALSALKENRSPNIVTLISNATDFSKWQAIVGARLLPGFPGVGGQLNDGVLNARYLPKVLASTTVGEIDGTVTPRLNELAALFEAAKRPLAIQSDMQALLMTHAVSDIAMLGTLYDDHIPDNRKAQAMAVKLKTTLYALQSTGISVTPATTRLILWIPNAGLRLFFGQWLKTNMVKEMKEPAYAQGAKREMQWLEADLEKYLHTHK